MVICQYDYTKQKQNKTKARNTHGSAVRSITMNAAPDSVSLMSRHFDE
jgi:hypothetical protein